MKMYARGYLNRDVQKSPMQYLDWFMTLENEDGFCCCSNLALCIVWLAQFYAYFMGLGTRLTFLLSCGLREENKWCCGKSIHLWLEHTKPAWTLQPAYHKCIQDLCIILFPAPICVVGVPLCHSSLTEGCDVQSLCMFVVSHWLLSIPKTD